MHYGWLAATQMMLCDGCFFQTHVFWFISPNGFSFTDLPSPVDLIQWLPRICWWGINIFLRLVSEKEDEWKLCLLGSQLWRLRDWKPYMCTWTVLGLIKACMGSWNFKWIQRKHNSLNSNWLRVFMIGRYPSAYQKKWKYIIQNFYLLLLFLPKRKKIFWAAEIKTKELAFHSKGNLQGVVPDRSVMALFLRVTAHTLRHVT